MTRLKKELRIRGIIYDAPDFITSPEDDYSRTLVDIVGDVIITVWSSAIMDDEWYLFDRHTLKMIGGQYMHPDRTFWGKSRTWGSFAVIEENGSVFHQKKGGAGYN